MDCFISHHNPLKYESVFFESIITILRLKKAPWIALLSTANFEKVIIINHFANFEQEFLFFLIYKKWNHQPQITILMQ